MQELHSYMAKGMHMGTDENLEPMVQSTMGDSYEQVHGRHMWSPCVESCSVSNDPSYPV